MEREIGLRQAIAIALVRRDMEAKGVVKGGPLWLSVAQRAPEAMALYGDMADAALAAALVHQFTMEDHAAGAAGVIEGAKIDSAYKKRWGGRRRPPHSAMPEQAFRAILATALGVPYPLAANEDVSA